MKARHRARRLLATISYALGGHVTFVNGYREPTDHCDDPECPGGGVFSWRRAIGGSRG